ncbi:MAG: phosphopantothenoylcysteine decarboxylase [Patescibacteria group bacterium]
MSKVLVTAGPIPARVDSVKYILNRFRGGLALKTAENLQKMGHEVTVLAWEYAGIETELPLIKIRDVNDYFEKVLEYKADAYILAAAVANLAPLNPFPGKFPSHNYKVGDVFPIEFTIAPRVIDSIKNKYPTATLVAYKLYDGTDEELIKAGKKTLFESRANIVFANHPKWAKEKKLVITADGAVFPVSFDEHIDLIDKLLKEDFYKTEIGGETTPDLTSEDIFIIGSYPKHRDSNMVFGTFAIRKPNGFLTTTRGKKLGEKSISFVTNVDHENRIVYANQKATLNAPLLHMLFQENPHIKYLVHGHELIGEKTQDMYQFPGTAGDLNNVVTAPGKDFLIELPHHGYIAGFSEFVECQEFIKKHND